MSENKEVEKLQWETELNNLKTKKLKLETEVIELETKIIKLQAQKIKEETEVMQKRLKYWWLPTVMDRDFIYLAVIIGLLLYI